MYFLIKTERALGHELRDDIVVAHRAYLEAHAKRILAVGPTFSESEDDAEGSVYLFEGDDWEEARRFMRDDPLTKSNGRSKIEVWSWVKKGFNGVYPLGS